jgi:hypothetical protein
MKKIKADTPSRKELGNFRRYATGRVGQITNSEEEINRIVGILARNPLSKANEPSVHRAHCSDQEVPPRL